MLKQLRIAFHTGEVNVFTKFFSQYFTTNASAYASVITKTEQGSSKFILSFVGVPTPTIHCVFGENSFFEKNEEIARFFDVWGQNFY